MKKKIMILGGSGFIIPLIKKAQDMGFFVITCDYLPNNIAHKYSDLYINVSIIDKEKVLEQAKKHNIVGISSFACDPGVVTAAYVAEKMGLPNVGPYESVEILQNKQEFRKFLKDNNFNVPWFYSYDNIDDALRDLNKFNYPLIIKPTDSAGSKGVTKLDNEKDFVKAFEYAKSFSLSKSVIIEEFLEKEGNSSSSDFFSIDGKLVFSELSEQLFDVETANIYNPCGTVLPSSASNSFKEYVTNEMQRLISLLGMQTSIYNVECRKCTNGKYYLMEVSPRGGGNRIAEIQSIAYDFDYIECVIKSMIGMKIDFRNPVLKYPCMTYVLHSDSNGIFDELFIDEKIKQNVVWSELLVKKGDYVEAFTGANKSFGILFLRFESLEQQRYCVEHVKDLIKIIVK